MFAHAHSRINATGDGQPCIIDRNGFLSQTSLPGQVLDTFLSHFSRTIDHLRELITDGKPWDERGIANGLSSPGFATDFRVFRRHPLMDLGDGKHLVIDPQLLEDLLSGGIYFQLLGGVPRDRRKFLFDLWGRVFELLIAELFDHFYPRSDRSSLAAPMFARELPFQGSLESKIRPGQIDRILDRGTEVLVFEFKHFLIAQDVKDSLDREGLEKALRSKLVMDW